jgi:hypothetical protein
MGRSTETASDGSGASTTTAVIQRTGGPVPDRRGRDQEACLRFTLNRQPDRLWVSLFRDYAGSEFLAATRIAFVHDAITVDVPSYDRLEDLMTALDCFIECANLAVAPRSASRSATDPVRAPRPPAETLAG